MAALTTIVPPIIWAQRKDSLYVTVKLAEATGVEIDLTASGLTFGAESEEKKYAFELAFSSPVARHSAATCTPSTRVEERLQLVRERAATIATRPGRSLGG